MASPTVELSMIVKDGATGLPRCLASVAPLVDRIVVGDTGSTDASVAIARSFGAEIVHLPWENDFAQARNRILALARCDWVLVLDADEMLDSSASETLARCLARDDIFAFDLWRWNYVAETNSRSGEEGALANPFILDCSRPYPAYVRSLSTRLFRRHSGIVFERPVHEHVGGSVQALSLPKALSPLAIHHFGQVEDPPEIRAGKNDLYAKIGEDHLRAHPTDARTFHELGLVELEHRHSPEAALARFTRARQLDPLAAAAWLFAGMCLLRLNRLGEALESLLESQRLDAHNIVLQEALGDTHFHRAQYSEASLSYLRAQALGGASVLVGAKLGACDAHLGRKSQSIERICHALECEPTFPELHDVASATALLAGELSLAASIAARRTTLAKATAFHFTLAATLARQTGDSVTAREILDRGLTHFPADAELQQALRQ